MVVRQEYIAFAAADINTAVVLAAATAYLFTVRRRAPRPLRVAATATAVLAAQAVTNGLYLLVDLPKLPPAVRDSFEIACRAVCLIALVWAVTADRRPGVKPCPTGTTS